MPAQFAVQDLEVPLSSTFKAKRLLSWESAGVWRDQNWTTGSRFRWLTAWTMCEVTNAGGKKKHSTHFSDRMHDLLELAPPLLQGLGMHIRKE